MITVVSLGSIFNNITRIMPFKSENGVPDLFSGLIEAVFSTEYLNQ